jgi:hypothetical protein
MFRSRRVSCFRSNYTPKTSAKQEARPFPDGGPDNYEATQGTQRVRHTLLERQKLLNDSPMKNSIEQVRRTSRLKVQ